MWWVRNDLDWVKVKCPSSVPSSQIQSDLPAFCAQARPWRGMDCLNFISNFFHQNLYLLIPKLQSDLNKKYLKLFSNQFFTLFPKDIVSGLHRLHPHRGQPVKRRVRLINGIVLEAGDDHSEHLVQVVLLNKPPAIHFHGVVVLGAAMDSHLD